jgi:8-oxo-dGTP pyrophosphatase MutT (NUDIX family)
MTARRGGAGATRKRAARTRQERSAGGVVVRIEHDTPLYLLIRDGYGHWGFPKGHVERGERADTAALREVMEETGLRSLTVVASIDTIEWFFRFRGRRIHKRCEFFLMESASSATVPQASEGITACKWTTLSDAIDLVTYDNARAVLRRADDMLAERRTAGGASQGA